MNDTDILPGPDRDQHDDSTEKTRLGPPAFNEDLEPDSTEESLPDEQTERSVVPSPPAAARPVTDAPAKSPEMGDQKLDDQAAPRRASASMGVEYCAAQMKRRIFAAVVRPMMYQGNEHCVD